MNLEAKRYGPLSGKTRFLAVMCHGYGADGDDMMALAPALAASAPDALFLAPNAPGRVVAGGLPGMGGRQWFELDAIDAGAIAFGVHRAVPILADFIDGELFRHSLDPGRLALMGFSQGAMVALHYALRRGRCAAALCYSGALAAPESLRRDCIWRPPVMLIHGLEDPLIPFSASEAAAAALREASVPVALRAIKGLGHGIDAQGIQMGGSFLARHLQPDHGKPGTWQG